MSGTEGKTSPLKSCGRTEGAKRTSIPFTVMIAAIASITIVLSLQRLVRSQARKLQSCTWASTEHRAAIFMAPLVIGAVGCGALMGPGSQRLLISTRASWPSITERDVPVALTGVMLPAMLVVFLLKPFRMGIVALTRWR